MGNLDDFLDVLADEDFEEEPVSLKEFLYDEGYLNLPNLSDEQYRLVQVMTNIYKYETNKDLWGKDHADHLKQLMVNEIIAMLGKGSGKDFCSVVAFCRIIYLLLCLRDPAEYYGKPSGDAIHLLNVAINAKQANNVFFTPFKQRIKKCAWFRGRYKSYKEHIEFDKNVIAHSGHSEREAWEGYNFIIVVLDEIAGFVTESEASASAGRDKTADAIYRMYARSVSSRFPKFGKLVLLSFPRFKGDFIQTRYEEVIAERSTEIKRHKFKLHEELPDGAEDNEFEIEWEYDKIISYEQPDVFAIRRATWEVNPTIGVNDFKRDFYNDMEDSLARFACMPPEAVDAYFKDKDKIELALPPGKPGPFNADWSFKESFKADEESEYYVHVDLGYTHDRAAVALSHVDKWVEITYGGDWKHWEPSVVLDAVRWWTPKTNQNVDFSEIEEYILTLRSRGFTIALVTFDRWQSLSTMKELESYGIDTDTLSVAKPHYDDLKVVISEERLSGYDVGLLRDELLSLKVIKGNKVDHPRRGSKDLSDAVCGSVYNTIAHTHRDEGDIVVEAEYLDPGPPNPKRTIEKPEPDPPRMPDDIREYLERAQVI